MSEDAHVPVEAHVRYESVRKKVKVFLNPIDKLDELKAQLNRYFTQIGKNQRTSHVIVQVPLWTWGRIRKRIFGRPCIIHNFSKMTTTLLACSA